METFNNKKQIGIPRAISYYNNYPFYYGFCSALGIEIVLSDKTTNKIVNEGTKYVVSDTCLPVKVFVGHVVNLLEKGVENIFCPSIQSCAYKINNCTKIRGLPEIIRNVINRPINIIEPVLDITNNLDLYDFCYEFARPFGITDKKLIKSAMKSGFDVYNKFLELSKIGVPFEKAIEMAINCVTLLDYNVEPKPLSVVVMAHGYNLFDDKVSMNLLKKLDKLDVRVYTGLNITKEQALSSITELGEIQYWANELDLTGAAAYYMLNKKVDGIVALSAFGCGPDSLMVEEISYHAQEFNLPLLHLNIDEHTGEAGFMTRLEAFIDMLVRRKRKSLNNQDIILKNDKTLSKLDEKVILDKELTNSLA